MSAPDTKPPPEPKKATPPPPAPLAAPEDAGKRVSPQQSPKDAFFYSAHSKPTVETSYRIRLICGNANRQLAADVAQLLNMELCRSEVTSFANGETSIKIVDNVRGDDCFVIQPTTGNEQIDINTALMELLLIINTLRLSSAKRVTAIVPYYAYSRQDRKTQSRVPISASAVSQLIQAMGVDRVVTVDLHCGQIQGFFRNMPLDNLYMVPEFENYIRHLPEYDPHTTVVVSPDAGGVERASQLADRLQASHIVTIIKRRVRAGVIGSMQTVGDVKGYTCVLVDDMVDTAGTLVTACDLLKQMGAKTVLACATHGILTSPAISRINGCASLSRLIISDSIPQAKHVEQCSKLVVLSIAPLLAASVMRLHHEESLSQLFTK